MMLHGEYATLFEGDMFLEFENGVLFNKYTKWLTEEEIEKINTVFNDFSF
ncbi:MAG: hypothetical protein NTW54_07185 [Bacteroidetes bacterium]|nr:hypothetical protein [Bacteroidota bacterium]